MNISPKQILCCWIIIISLVFLHDIYFIYPLVRRTQSLKYFITTNFDFFTFTMHTIKRVSFQFTSYCKLVHITHRNSKNLFCKLCHEIYYTLVFNLLFRLSHYDTNWTLHNHHAQRCKHGTLRASHLTHIRFWIGPECDLSFNSRCIKETLSVKDVRVVSRLWLRSKLFLKKIKLIKWVFNLFKSILS